MLANIKIYLKPVVFAVAAFFIFLFITRISFVNAFGGYGRLGFVFGNLAVNLPLIVAGFVLPLLFIKYVLKKPFKDFGLKWPDKNGWKWTLIITLIFLPIVFALSKIPEMRQYYIPYYGRVFHGPVSAVFYLEFVLTFFYFISEEFFFRGFLLLPLWPKLGYHGYWIVALLFMIFHLGKSPSETIFSFFGSYMLDYLSIKSGSAVAAGIVHYVISRFFILFLFV